MFSRREIKSDAKLAMKQQFGTAILIGIMVSLITGISTSIDFAVGRIFGIFSIPYHIVYWGGFAIIIVAGINAMGEFIKISKGETASVASLFSEFRVNFLRKLGGSLLVSLWIGLWTLLLIIPGIIKTMSYYFTWNILADCPNVRASQAIKISMRMTKGYKMELFVWVLSWFGWLILSAFTLGLLYIFYVGPYMQTADAGLYLRFKEEALANGTITYEELGETPPHIVDYSN